MLLCVANSRLKASQGALISQQKSAEHIRHADGEGPNRGRGQYAKLMAVVRQPISSG